MTRINAGGVDEAHMRATSGDVDGPMQLEPAGLLIERRPGELAAATESIGMALIRTVDEPFAASDEVLIAVVNGECRMIVCIANAAIDHLAGISVDTGLCRIHVAETQWKTIARVAEAKIYPGLSRLCVGIEDLDSSKGVLAAPGDYPGHWRVAEGEHLQPSAGSMPSA